jgi:hypothetical protein
MAGGLNDLPPERLVEVAASPGASLKERLAALEALKVRVQSGLAPAERALQELFELFQRERHPLIRTSILVIFGVLAAAGVVAAAVYLVKIASRPESGAFWREANRRMLGFRWWRKRGFLDKLYEQLKDPAVSGAEKLRLIEGLSPHCDLGRQFWAQARWADVRRFSRWAADPGLAEEVRAGLSRVLREAQRLKVENPARTLQDALHRYVRRLDALDPDATSPGP